MVEPVCSLSPQRTLAHWEIVSKNPLEEHFLGSAKLMCRYIPSWLSRKLPKYCKRGEAEAGSPAGGLVVVATVGKDVDGTAQGGDLVSASSVDTFPPCNKWPYLLFL